MPIRSQSSLMMLVSKLAPQSCHKTLATIFVIWLRVTYAMMCFIKWSQNTKKVHHIWGLIHLHCCLNAGKVNMQQLPRFGNADGLHWCFGMNALMLDASLAAANCPLHLSSHACHSAGSLYTVGLGVQYRDGIHSWQLPNGLWGPQITKLLPVCQQRCGNCKGLPGRVLTSSALRE